MNFSRRRFIGSLGAAATMMACGNLTLHAQKSGRVQDLFPVPAEVSADPLYSMTAKQFEAMLGRTFDFVSTDGVTSQVLLTEVNVIDRPGNLRRGFQGEVVSLIFEGDLKDGLVQDTYEIRGELVKEFSALVVPTGRQRKQYEIILNRTAR